MKIFGINVPFSEPKTMKGQMTVVVIQNVLMGLALLAATLPIQYYFINNITGDPNCGDAEKMLYPLAPLFEALGLIFAIVVWSMPRRAE